MICDSYIHKKSKKTLSHKYKTGRHAPQTVTTYGGTVLTKYSSNKAFHSNDINYHTKIFTKNI